MNFVVLYDACILYPAPLRDLLMYLALSDLYQAKWSARIHDEWIRNLLASRPDLSPEKLERTRQLMDTHVRDALVEGYEDLIESLELPDPDDRHVLAAAIKGNADFILTFNLKDFPETALSPYNIEAQHPDIFLTSFIDLATNEVCTVVKQHRESLKNPPKNVSDYLETIEKQGLSQFTERLRELSELI